MNPITHFLTSWVVANCADLEKRERVAVTVAGVIPDIDGLGIVAEKLTAHWERPLLWWSDYHHVLTHNLGFGLFVGATCFAVAKNRVKTAGLALLAFHLHLIGDLVGARGPEGYQWPIPYLEPFSDAWQLVWAGQWYLTSWQNFMITAIAIGITIYLAYKKGYSPLEMISEKTDRVFVKAVRKRVAGKNS